MLDHIARVEGRSQGEIEAANVLIEV